MKRATLYSSSVRSRDTGQPGQTGPQPPPQADATQAPARPARRWRRLYDRYEKPLLVAAGGIFALALVYAHGSKVPVPREITQQDIDSAVLRTLENAPLPSRAAKAYEAIRPSVVRVRGLDPG